MVVNGIDACRFMKKCAWDVYTLLTHSYDADRFICTAVGYGTRLVYRARNDILAPSTKGMTAC